MTVSTCFFHEHVCYAQYSQHPFIALILCPLDIKIVTKEIFNTDGKSQNWTNRAGSFLEQSRAFFDTYLGRWDRSNGEDVNDETIDDCTSGATSGEEVWGTPTSGENDEIQMFNSDQTHSVSGWLCLSVHKIESSFSTNL